MTYIGTAGWSIPREYSVRFPIEGSHLARYSKVFSAVEINSSFYKEHQAKTYVRWRETVADEFRFSVKLSRVFTHELRFYPPAKEFKESIKRILQLEKKLGVLLIQLPASLEFNFKNALRFYKLIRKQYQGPIVLEPRNTLWLSKDSQKLLLDFGISKVVADPERCHSETKKILSAGGLVYYRLHGSPIIYRSSYSQSFIQSLSKKIKNEKNVWCIFDNTTLGKATGNALQLQALPHHPPLG